MIWLRMPRAQFGGRTHWVGYHQEEGPDVCYIHRHKYNFQLHERAKVYSYVLRWCDARYSETFTSLKKAKQRAETREAAKTQEVD